jgi:hypothetical protein
MCGVLHPNLEGPLERPLGIYASSLTRRGLARRRARMRHPVLYRVGNLVAVGAVLALGATVVERLLG